MSTTDYDSQAEIVAKIIDIAIDCFNNTPPIDFQKNDVERVVKAYLNFKNEAINPEPSFRNIKSLNQTKSEALTYFQEDSGKTVDVFWEKIHAQKIKINRTNRFEQILKRGKIKNQTEYDTVIDLFTPYIQTNMLSEDEVVKVNGLIFSFEKKGK